MLFNTFSEYLEKLEQTSSRNDMPAILAGILGKSSSREVDKISYFLVGRISPLYKPVKFNIGEKLMIKILKQAYAVGEKHVEKQFEELGDLGDVAENLSEKGDKSSLEVVDVYRELSKIAAMEGENSVERKITGFARLLSQLSPSSAKYIVRLPLEKMRLGLGEKTILDALSWMEREDKSLRGLLERSYSIRPDIGFIVKTFREKGVDGIAGISISVGRPILPMLCQRVPTADEVMEKMGVVFAEPKFDGTRVQIHLDKSQNANDEAQSLFSEIERSQDAYLLKAFTRNLEDVTSMFPDIMSAVVGSVNAESIILDGEAVGYDSDSGDYLPFQVTMQRKRKHGIKEKSSEIPLRYFVFDLLYLDGESFLKKNYTQRRERLIEIIDSNSDVQLTESTKINSAEDLVANLEKAVGDGLEGLVIKGADSQYEAGSRGFSWVKFKYEGEDSLLADTIDCVVLGYYSGKGRRSNLGIGAFLVAVYDRDSDKFKTVSKIGTGLTDEQWREMKNRCDKAKVDEAPARYSVPKELKPSVWSSPDTVMEISADEITKSPLHTAGYALRFPRLKSLREDKKPKDATTLQELKTMFKNQFSRVNRDKETAISE